MIVIKVVFLKTVSKTLMIFQQTQITIALKIKSIYNPQIDLILFHI